MIERLRKIANSSLTHSTFSIIFNTTPSFTEAEAVMCRFITMDYNIIELLARYNLYEKKLNSIEIKAHLKDAILNWIGKKMRDQMSVQSDRVSTNKAAIRYIKEEKEKTDSTENPCVSHTLSNGDKKVLGALGALAKYPEEFHKNQQVVINNPRKARDNTTERFDASTITSGGVRFFNKLK